MKRISDGDVLYLLQYMVTNLVGRGYIFHCRTQLPEKKRDRWDDIASKVAGRYLTRAGESIFALSKDQRARRKKAGLLNAALLCWRDYLFILATSGRDDVGLFKGENMLRWPSARIRIPAAANFVYEIVQKDGRCTVALSKDCFQAKLAFFEDLAIHRPLEQVRAVFQEEEHLMPSYSGVFTQKRKLVKALVAAAKRAGRSDFSRELFLIDSRRRIVHEADD